MTTEYFDIIRDMLRDCGITNQQIAVEAGVSVSTIKRVLYRPTPSRPPGRHSGVEEAICRLLSIEHAEYFPPKAQNTRRREFHPRAVSRKAKSPITATCPRCGMERRNIGDAVRATYRCTAECERAITVRPVEVIPPRDQCLRVIGFDNGQGVDPKYYRPVSVHIPRMAEAW